jgi:hypothetical protein
MQINMPYHVDTGQEAMVEKISIRRTQKDKEENMKKLGILLHEDGKISVRKIQKDEQENKKK